MISSSCKWLRFPDFAHAQTPIDSKFSQWLFQSKQRETAVMEPTRALLAEKNTDKISIYQTNITTFFDFFPNTCHFII